MIRRIIFLSFVYMIQHRAPLFAGVLPDHEILVQFHDQAELETNFSPQGVEKEFIAPQIAIFKFTQGQNFLGSTKPTSKEKKERALRFIENLRKRPDVRFAELDSYYSIQTQSFSNSKSRYEIQPSDVLFQKQWGLKNTGQVGSLGKKGKPGTDIGISDVWRKIRSQRKVVVAVVDSGIDLKHPDLNGKIWRNKKEIEGVKGDDDDGNGYVDDYYGWDYIESDGKPNDNDGHGTQISGVIAAERDNRIGIAGIAENVEILPLRFVSGTKGKKSDAIRAIYYAIEKDVNIINASWGGSLYSDILLEAIQKARQKKILFVTAAGNRPLNTDYKPLYPSSYEVENILSVGAMNRHGRKSNFSSFGKKSVDLFAPGEEIITTELKDKYGLARGTSIAAPFASGVAALLMGESREKIEPQEIIDRLIDYSKKSGHLRAFSKSGGFLNADLVFNKRKSEKDLEDPFYWQKQNVLVETKHPYQKKMFEEWWVEVPGAKEISLHFEKIETENSVDRITLFDESGSAFAQYSGRIDDFYSPAVKGKKIKIRMTSDRSNQGFGFRVDRIAFRQL